MATDQSKAYPFARISSKWTEYLMMDADNLRTRYRSKVLRGGGMFFRINKEKMARLLLETEFGEAALKAYEQQCAEWREAERDFIRNAAAIRQAS